MKAEELKGHLDGVLLSVLDEGPLHGYAVIEQVRSTSQGAVDLPTGTVYPALHRLERHGLLGSEWTRVGSRRRRTYFLTDDGRRALSVERTRWAEFVRSLEAVMNPDPASTHA